MKPKRLEWDLELDERELVSVDPADCSCRLLLPSAPAARSCFYRPGAVVDPFSVNSPSFTIQMPLWTSLK